MTIKRPNHKKGIRLDPTDLTTKPLENDGDISLDSNDDIFKARSGGIDKELVTSDQTQTLTNKTIDADQNTITNIEDSDIKVGAAIDVTKLADGSVDNTEFQQLNGVSSNIQTQIDSKIGVAELSAHEADTSTHGITSTIVGESEVQTLTNKTIDADQNTITNIDNADIKVGASIDRSKLAIGTASKIVVNDGSGVLSDSSTDSSQLQYLDNVTSDIQFQIDNKPDITATTDNRLLKTNGPTDIQESGISVSDTDEVTGISLLEVDDVRVDGSSVSSIASRLEIGSAVDGVYISDFYSQDVTTDAVSTGASTFLPESSYASGIVRLTNAGLTGIQEIATGQSGQDLTIINHTGNKISIVNDSTPGVGNSKILTGQKKNIDLDDEASITLKYDNTESAWMVIGGTGGASAGSDINYLSDASEQQGLWTNGANFTVSENTSSPIRNDKDLKFSKTAVDASGQYVYTTFTIDPHDQSKLLPILCDIKTDANIADGDFEVEIYDNTNAVVVPNLYPRILANESGYTLKSYVQMSPDSTSYQFRFKVITTSTLVMEFQIARLTVGPLTIATDGPYSSDYEIITTTIKGSISDPTKGTTTKDSFMWWRNGSNFEAIVAYEQTSAGTAGSGTYYFELPNGWSISDDIEELQEFGSGRTSNVADSYSTTTTPLKVVYNPNIGRRGVVLRAIDLASGVLKTNMLPVGSVNHPLSGTNRSYFFHFKVPIQGWQTGIKSSQIGTNRDISFEANTVTTNHSTSGVWEKVIFDTVRKDKAAGFDIVLSRYIFDETAEYNINAGIKTASASGLRGIAIYKNGSVLKTGDERAVSSDIYTGDISLLSESFQKGDYVEVFVYQASGGALAYDASSSSCYFQVSKKPSVLSHITPTEKIYIRYTSSNGQTLTGGDTVIFETKVKDTHNCYNPSTGELTIPRTGYYTLKGLMSSSTSTSWSAGDNFAFDLVVNGSIEMREPTRITSAITNSIKASISGSFYWEEGDVITLEMPGTGGPNPSLINSPLFNIITVISED